MKPNSSSDGFVRRVRLSVAWYTLREYVNGALWVLPGAAGLAALAVGFAMSQVTVARVRRWIAWPSREPPTMPVHCSSPSAAQL